MAKRLHIAALRGVASTTRRSWRRVWRSRGERQPHHRSSSDGSKRLSKNRAVFDTTPKPWSRNSSIRPGQFTNRSSRTDSPRCDRRSGAVDEPPTHPVEGPMSNVEGWYPGVFMTSPPTFIRLHRVCDVCQKVRIGRVPKASRGSAYPTLELPLPDFRPWTFDFLTVSDQVHHWQRDNHDLAATGDAHVPSRDR